MHRHIRPLPRRIGALLVALTGVLLGLGGPAGAEGPRLRLERVRFDRLPDLTAYVNLVNGDGTVIGGQPPGEFKLVIDDAELGAGTRAVPFAAAGEPIFIVGVVQLSPPVEPILDEARRGLRAVAAAAFALPGGHVDLVGYATDVKRLCEGCSAAQLGAVIDRLAVDPEGAEVRLLEAVQVGIDLLRPQPAGARKVVVVVSDGIDINNERKLFTEVARRAERAGVVIAPIGYAPFEASKLRMLAELAQRSGGVERVARAPAEMGARFGALIDELQKQYVVTFPLPLGADGKEHSFQVIADRSGLPAASQTVTRVFAAEAPILGAPAVQGSKEAGWRRLWPLGALPLFLLGVGVWLWRRRRQVPQAVPASPPAQPSLPSMRSPPQAMRTIALGQGQDAVVGWLTGLSSPCKGRDFKLGRRVVLGSAADCDIVIGDPTVSSRHCEVRQAPDGFKLIDLGSTNGLIVNDHRTREHHLIDNDVFRVGRVEFKFKSI